MPIAIDLARRNPRSTLLVLGAGVDIVGVAITTTFTSMLITGRMTFQGSLSGVLGGQALIGCWILMVGLAALAAPDSRRMATLALAGGAGLVATAAGVAFGGMESPLAFAGFVGGLVGTIGFYALLGRRRSR